MYVCELKIYDFLNTNIADILLHSSTQKLILLYIYVWLLKYKRSIYLVVINQLQICRFVFVHSIYVNVNMSIDFLYMCGRVQCLSVCLTIHKYLIVRF